MLNFIKALFVESLKAIVISEVQAEGDKLQKLLRARLVREGVGSVDRTVDAAQVRVISAIQTRGPMWRFLLPIREKLVAAVQKFGDDLQDGIKREARAHGPAAVDRVFDTTQSALIRAIEAISL